ncbi:hydrogenase expression/formation protein HypE [Cognatiyoonia sp. IB215182]|uniref:hydrogenase expression/formation protein HypE n=1 Tax=Cognatiyoonia sp. IB215182 TaxID=3097353 RepID=UPI002A119834|nr:hydrogenase expression/formation protein HypE [Cognatiyoonia sp. IB215182]MDX8354971.1 hydrogenase expression/formation protein HypE [Cognatiyoonia sp. IB215182]
MTTGNIDMTHGGGGRAMVDLISDIFQRHLSNPILDRGDDAGLVSVPGHRLVMSTDGHVISPLFFPGGDIGALSVHGTINDLAMMGAKPLYLTAGFILEEGFSIADLHRIVQSMAKATNAAGVQVIAGDTKVVERRKSDGVFITTTGLGAVPDGLDLSVVNVQPGQSILVSGTMGDHGVAVLSKRENLSFETEIKSDAAAMHGLVADMVAAVPKIAMLRDPTRGGLAATLNEIAASARVGMQLDETHIPVAPDVAAACELLGLDPLNTANEGKLIAICPHDQAETLLTTMRAHPLGKQAAIIGNTTDHPAHLVQMRTIMGGNRIIDWLAGEQLPRIC